jgi:hypothetical protein
VRKFAQVTRPGATSGAASSGGVCAGSKDTNDLLPAGLQVQPTWPSVIDEFGRVAGLITIERARTGCWIGDEFGIAPRTGIS